MKTLNGIERYKHFLKQQESTTKYIITGKDINNKRFAITTATPENYNIHNGNIWLLQENGKRKLIKRILNY